MYLYFEALGAHISWAGWTSIIVTTKRTSDKVSNATAKLLFINAC